MNNAYLRSMNVGINNTGRCWSYSSKILFFYGNSMG
nr:MAG TPA: hypothetical protein [Caudoviricetes sp.]